MGAVASQSPALRLFTQPFIQTQIKENIKATRHWPLSPVPGEFPVQMASNAENVSIWRCHHDQKDAFPAINGLPVTFQMDLYIKTFRPRQNGRHFAPDMFRRIFVNEKYFVLIQISQKFVPNIPISNHLSLVQIMAWRRSGDKPLSELMMVSRLWNGGHFVSASMC